MIFLLPLSWLFEFSYLTPDRGVTLIRVYLGKCADHGCDKVERKRLHPKLDVLLHFAFCFVLG